MAVDTPKGIAAIVIKKTNATVPKIAGNIPPFIIPSFGGEVKNSQLMVPAP